MIKKAQSGKKEEAQRERRKLRAREEAETITATFTATAKENMREVLSRMIKTFMADATISDEVRVGLSKVHTAVMVNLPE